MTTGPASAPAGGAAEEGPDALADRLAALARSLEAEPVTTLMLGRLVAGVLDVVPGVDEASLSLVVARKGVVSEQPSSDLPRTVDALQEDLGEGPCLAAIGTEQVVRVPDLDREDRWPAFVPRARLEGVGSMLCLPLAVESGVVGSLNLISRRAQAFDEESEHVGRLVADHAAVAYADARKVDDLHSAVRSRDLIGQAKGILMERYGIDDRPAFRLLVRVSQTTHQPLRDVAAELVSTRRLAALESTEPSSDAGSDGSG